MSAGDAAAGVVFILIGAVLIFHRGFRDWWAKGIIDFHEGPARRFPWLYGPKPLREWMLSEDGQKQFIAVIGGVAVLMGVVVILAAFLD